MEPEYTLLVYAPESEHWFTQSWNALVNMEHVYVISNYLGWAREVFRLLTVLLLVCESYIVVQLLLFGRDVVQKKIMRTHFRNI